MNISTPRGILKICPAEVNNAEVFRDLRLRALREHPLAFTADYDTTMARPAEHWAERLDAQGKNGNIYFAFHETELVGMTGIQMGDSPKTRHSAIIWGVYTLPEWRGLHIVDALLEACIEWGREQGVAVVKLGVTANNAPAIQSYLRLGFSIYGVEPRAVFYDGVMYDELLMARMIL